MQNTHRHAGFQLFLVSCALQAAALGGSSHAAAQASSPFEQTVSGADGTWQHFTVEIPAGTTDLNVQLSGGTGDADLYVRQGAEPTLTDYGCRPWLDGNDENCKTQNPQAGTWHISLFAYTQFADVALKATWTTPAANPQQPVNAAVADWQKQMLDQHNLLRAKHCAPELSWSTELAAKAQAWAERCEFEHSGPGENLSAGTQQTAVQTVDGWYAEIAKYDFAKPGSQPDTGHFTQVVWRNTKQLGCGVARCGNIFPEFGGAFFYVCQYAEAGNNTNPGQFEQNVAPVSDGGVCQ